MATDTQRIAAECWKKATEAMNRMNWDYAIDMMSKTVALVPDNLAYRQALRGCERKKYNDNKTGARMAGMKLMSVRTRIKKCRLQKDWKSVDRAAEEGLAINPWDSQLNAEMAEACRERGFLNCAQFGYEAAIENDPKNLNYSRELAKILEERNDFDYAIRCWEQVQKLEPLNTEARQRIAELVSRRTIEHGGYQDAEDTKDVATTSASAYEEYRRPKPQAQAADDGPGADAVKDLERAVRKDPQDVNNYLKLGDLLRTQKEYERAFEVYESAVEASNGDPNVREQRDDCEVDVLRARFDQAKMQLRNAPDDEKLRKAAAVCNSQLIKREIEVLSNKVERYPKDARIKLDLATRLMRVKKYSQSIPLLQRAAASPQLELEVLVNLGECFVREKKHDLARRQFEKAVPKLDSHENEEHFKRCHYMLGLIYKRAGNQEKFEHHFNEVLAVDYEYKDVLQQLETAAEEE